MHAGFWSHEYKSLQNATFCGSAVFWWLIWVPDHIMLPQQKEKAAKMCRSWPLNLPVLEKECATRSLNSFISFRSLLFQQNPLKESKKNNIRKQTPLAEWLSDTAETSRWWFYVSQKNTWLAARWKDVTVCASERLEGCLSRLKSPGNWHLSPSVFHHPTPGFCPPLSHTLCFSCHTVPTSKASPPLIFLITQTVHYYSSSSSHSSVREWKGWDGWKWGWRRRRGRFVRFGGLMRSERCCFGSRNLSCNMHPIDPFETAAHSAEAPGRFLLVCKLGDGSLMWWKREQFENSQISPAAIIPLVLSIFIHFPLIFVNVSRPVSPAVVIIITI